MNTISPGPVVTDMLETAVPGPEAREAMRAQVPLGRLGRAEDVAAVAGFLLSPLSSYITGQDLVVDGGMVGSVPA